MRFTPTADTTNAVLTFHTAYAVPPTCVVTAANAGAQVDIIKAGFFVATATNTLTLTAPAANWANTAKVFNYVCIE
jgi:hypothetical protein